MPGEYHPRNLESLFPVSKCPECASDRFTELAFCRKCEKGYRFVCRQCHRVYIATVACTRCDLLKKDILGGGTFPRDRQSGARSI